MKKVIIIAHYTKRARNVQELEDRVNQKVEEGYEIEFYHIVPDPLGVGFQHFVTMFWSPKENKPPAGFMGAVGGAFAGSRELPIDYSTVH